MRIETIELCGTFGTKHLKHGRNCQSLALIYDSTKFFAKLLKKSTSVTEKGAVFAVLKKKPSSQITRQVACESFETCMGEQMVFMGTHVEKSLKKQNEQWIKMMKFLICDNFPKKFQDKEEFCESVSIPEPSESEVAAGSLEEDSDESDSEEPYSLDSHNDQAIPVDQMMMILLKHFYRGGVFIVGDLNMRLKSSADVNEDLFSRLRCNQPDAIATVIESDLNTDEPLRSVGNFKVDYPYALPPSYDFGNFQLKSLLSDKTVQAHCNNAGIHLLSKWTRNGCDTTVPPRVLSPREQRVLVVPEKFYLTLPT
jgi:hypothetical protein